VGARSSRLTISMRRGWICESDRVAEVRRFKAGYAPSIAVEIDRSCPLSPGEQVLAHGRIRVRHGWRSPLGYYRVSSDRLCVLTHHALGPDEVVEVPRSCITKVSPPNARGGVTVECANSASLVLSPFSWAQVFAAAGRAAAPRIDPRASQEIYEALTRE
jgi:hypothetical protein